MWDFPSLVSLLSLAFRQETVWTHSRLTIQARSEQLSLVERFFHPLVAWNPQERPQLVLVPCGPGPSAMHSDEVGQA